MYIKPLLIWCAITITIVSAAGAKAQPAYCRPPDTYGPALVADLQKLVTVTDARTRAARDSFYHVPVVVATAIVLVTDEGTCRRAAKVLTSFENSRPPVTAGASVQRAGAAPTRRRQVVVVRHGTFWAVEDPDAAPNGRFMTVVLFDSRWKQVGGYSGP